MDEPADGPTPGERAITDQVRARINELVLSTREHHVVCAWPEGCAGAATRDAVLRLIETDPGTAAFVFLQALTELALREGSVL